MSRITSLLLLCIISFSSLSHAQSPRWRLGQDFTKKAAAKESTRWTLSDWLAIKDRNSMMDMWLTMNTPSPYEFMLGAGYLSGKTEVDGVTPSTNHIGYAGAFSAYAKFVGLTAEYEKNSDDDYQDLTGIFNLRVLGNSLQNTSLTLHYGLRTREQGTNRLAQQFAQATLQIYLMKYFGLDGSYRYYLPTNNDTLGDIKTTKTEAGAFIDFSAFRIYGTYYQEQQKNTPTSGPESTTTQTGIKSGLKIFF